MGPFPVLTLDPKTVEDRLKSRDLLFQTLDTTLRQVTLPESGRQAILADSVEAAANLRAIGIESAVEVLKEVVLLRRARVGIVSIKLWDKIADKEQVALRHVFVEVAFHHARID